MIDRLVNSAPLLWLAYAFAVGAVVGSFLNVVIARVPLGESIVHPRSRCPRCKNPIAWFDNLPILSWLILRARCRHCGLPISIRYPIVEALVGIIAVAIAQQFGASLAALGYFVFAAAMVALAYIDLDTWLLPLEITIPLLILGVLSPLWNQALALPISGFLPLMRPLALAFISSVGGALAGGLFLAAIAFIGERLGREWMGWGDVWLLAGIGAWLGLPSLLPVMMLASVQGAIVGVALLLFGKALGARESGAIAEQQRKARLEEANEEQAKPAEATAEQAPALPIVRIAADPAAEDLEAEEEEEDDWVPPATAVPFGPFLVLASLEQLLLGEKLWTAWMHVVGRMLS